MATRPRRSIVQLILVSPFTPIHAKHVVVDQSRPLPAGLRFCIVAGPVVGVSEAENGLCSSGGNCSGPVLTELW